MTTNSPSAKRFLDACYGRPVDRAPAWMMRQAGRYLPEYREVRGRVSFLELCRNVDLAAEVSLQPFRRFAPDGVVFFSDILVPVQAMGARVEFGKEGPRLSHPVRTGDDVLRLRRFDPAGELRFTGGILKKLRGELGDSAAVIGFAGAPWTLACYLVEGGGSKSFAAIKQMMGWGQRTLEGLLNLLADVVGDVLSYQIASGAQVVQLFDTWAGELSREDYRRWALPAVTRAIAGIRREGQPVLLYVNGSAHLLEAMNESGADVLSIDWRLPLSEARKRLPTRPLQGNLDPGTLLAGTRDVRRRVRSILAETGGIAHVVNLGHGVLPQTPIESVEAFFATVREAGVALPAEAQA
ncbi:MAG TPA: uroporphyrinogen decarboxylase [Thermoanaerobaculia bacterium]|jgi:uroporphyrinogen decarboxylase|nr:uroporphyrinogen decarboxylase [Thermoanaerobaculia bacterium]HEV8609130.1 uroporphyrinogen decarboxylase [Thermoanaerobaculia bacterium]